MKIAIGYNTSHYAWMFRSSLIQRLVSLGHEVVVIAPKDEYSEKFSNLGASFIHLPIRMNNNPFSDILIFFRFLNILKSENIRIYLGYTVKPNIYGSLAAHILKIKVINPKTIIKELIPTMFELLISSEFSKCFPYLFKRNNKLLIGTKTQVEKAKIASKMIIGVK